jgi:hypothetical protein
MWAERHRWLAVAAAVVVAVLLVGATATAASHNWKPALASGSKAQAKSLTPAAPTSVRAACVTSSTAEVRVSWDTVTHASGYTVYEKATTGSYASVATVTTTTWTSGSLTHGTYTFEVSTKFGSRWLSAKSSASTTIRIRGHCS